jgi:5'-nucleotidase
VSQLLRERPEAVISGVNFGENSGTSSIYSGTVAAAREGALWGIPSFAFSVAGGNAELPAAYARNAVEIVEWLMSVGSTARGGSSSRVFYNINFPNRAPSQCRGLRVTRQSLAFFDDRYRPIGGDDGAEGFMLYGEKRDLEPDDGFDSRALQNGYATVTPMSIDATHLDALMSLQGLEVPVLSGG